MTTTERGGGLGFGRVPTAAVVALVLAGAVFTVMQPGPSRSASAVDTRQSAPAQPQVTTSADATGVTAWSRPLTIMVRNASLMSVVATGDGGRRLAGALHGPATWESDDTLVPLTSYRLMLRLRSQDGSVAVVQRTVTASAPEKVLQATVSPDGGTFGVGQPVIVQFNRPVTSQADRAAVVRRLLVRTPPTVPGAWHWFSPTEVHFRGSSFWPAGAVVRVSVGLSGLRLVGSDVWGAAHQVETGFVVDGALIATVDVTAHLMTVTQGGRVLRVIKVSTGRDKYPTKGGVHLVLAREKVQTYDSSTVGIPTASPDGYFEKLPWSVRISDGGAFVHANPATLGSQGRVNVSHGCVNTSVEDAKWFYDHSHLGDLVTVIHASAPPVLSDRGMFDWN